MKLNNKMLALIAAGTIVTIIGGIFIVSNEADKRIVAEEEQKKQDKNWINLRNQLNYHEFTNYDIEYAIEQVYKQIKKLDKINPLASFNFLM